MVHVKKREHIFLISHARTGSICGKLCLLGMQCGGGPADSHNAGFCSTNIWDLLLSGWSESNRVLLCAADSARNEGILLASLMAVHMLI